MMGHKGMLQVFTPGLAFPVLHAGFGIIQAVELHNTLTLFHVKKGAVAPLECSFVTVYYSINPYLATFDPVVSQVFQDVRMHKLQPDQVCTIKCFFEFSTFLKAPGHRCNNSFVTFNLDIVLPQQQRAHSIYFFYNLFGCSTHFLFVPHKSTWTFHSSWSFTAMVTNPIPGDLPPWTF